MKKKFTIGIDSIDFSLEKKGEGMEVRLSVEGLPLVSIWGSLTAFGSRLLDVGVFSGIISQLVRLVCYSGQPSA